MALYAFDGTWNVEDRKGAIQRVQPPQYGPDAGFRRETTETNVHRFREFYGADRCEYLKGVGTRFAWLGRIVGGVTGAGGKWRIRRMYRRLCERYHAGDHDIDIIGFSRGAALAVHFANVIEHRGIGNPARKHFAWSYDRMLGWSFRMPKADRSAEPPPVRFLGLWDMVASFGLPIGPLRNPVTTRWSLTTVAGNVRHSFHAMALDEVRATFELVRPQPKGDPDHHYEVWFRGVHSNIGGGYLDRGLSDIALAWMLEMYMYALDKETLEGRDVDAPQPMKEALEWLDPEAPRTGIPWRGTSLETLEPNPDGELGRPRDIRRQGWRPVPAEALIHHSVYRRTRNLLLDHYSSNRRLLRQIPGDARPVYDPPFFYGRTRRQQAMDLAEQAFCNVPVRAASWFKVDGRFVVRGDDWIGIGRRRCELSFVVHERTFIDIATRWLLSGCIPAAELEPMLPSTYPAYDENDPPQLRHEVAPWVLEVLSTIEPFVAGLREWPHTRQAPAPTAPAPDARDAGSLAGVG